MNSYKDHQILNLARISVGYLSDVEGNARNARNAMAIAHCWWVKMTPNSLRVEGRL